MLSDVVDLGDNGFRAGVSTSGLAGFPLGFPAVISALAFEPVPGDGVLLDASLQVALPDRRQEIRPAI